MGRLAQSYMTSPERTSIQILAAKALNSSSLAAPAATPVVIRTSKTRLGDLSKDSLSSVNIFPRVSSSEWNWLVRARYFVDYMGGTHMEGRQSFSESPEEGRAYVDLHTMLKFDWKGHFTLQLKVACSSMEDSGAGLQGACSSEMVGERKPEQTAPGQES